MTANQGTAAQSFLSLGWTRQLVLVAVQVLLGGKPREMSGRGAIRPAKETGAVLAAAAAAHARTCAALAPVAKPGAWDEYCLALQARRALSLRGGRL